MTEESLEGLEFQVADLYSPDELEVCEQFMLLHRVNSTNSNKRGKKYELMPSLKRAHKLKDNQVIDQLVRLNSSVYMGVNHQ